MTRVLHDRRYTQSAFEQLGLFPGEGPRVRIAFAAIVASKDDDRILAHPGGLDSGQDLPDLRVHGFDHIGKNLCRSTVEMRDIAIRVVKETLGAFMSIWPLPGPEKRQRGEEG